MWPNFRWAGVKSGGAVLLAVLSVGAVQQTARRLPAPAPERRLALVIGNDSYPNAPLRNALNDARAMAQALQELGFSVTRVENASQQVLATAMGAFGGRLQSNDVAVFYFAGHGVQVEGENYLIPADFRGDSEAMLRFSAIRASEVQTVFQRARVTVLILDACRTNPFGGSRAGGTGLAAMEPRGSLVVFATGANQTASDNPSASNGLFTAALLDALREPGLTVRDVFHRARQRVYAETDGKQFPAIYDGLLGDVVLRPALGPTAPTESRPPESEWALKAELALWESTKDSTNPSLFEEYLRQYPQGRFRAVAEERLAELRAGASKPAPPSPATSAPAPAPPPPAPKVEETPPRPPPGVALAPPASAVEEASLPLATPSSRVSDAVTIEPSGGDARKWVGTLTKAVDEAMAGRPSRQDFDLRFYQFHFMRGQRGTYVPFTLILDTGRTDSSLAIYLRVSGEGANAFEDVYLARTRSGGVNRLRRAFEVAGGRQYAVSIAAVETSSTDGAQRVSVVRRTMLVPDYWNGEFAMSSLILADVVEQRRSSLSATEQKAQPYTIGATRVVPAMDATLNKSEELKILALIYNPSLRGRKPDVVVEYKFYSLVSGEEARYFNKTEPTKLNANTLPPEFDLDAGHQLVSGTAVPMSVLSAGEYRLDVEVTDQLSGKQLTRSLRFVVRQ